MKSNNICIFLHQGIGDCVMALPSLRKSIDDNMESINYHLVVKSNVERDTVLLAETEVKCFHFVKANNKYTRFIKMLKAAIILRFKSINILVAPLFSHNFFNRVIVKIISPDAVYILDKDWNSNVNLFKSDSANDRLHHSEKIANLFYQAGLVSFRDFLEIKERRDYVSTYLNDHKIDCIAIGPGCGFKEAFKAPSLEWFVGLAIQLNHNLSPKRVIMYGGPSDETNLKIIGSSFNDSNVDFLINENVSDLVDKLKESDFIISGDSGPGHLAGLCGKPLIVLSEAINPAMSTPYINNIVVVRAGLRCSPCYRPGFSQGCKILRCNDLIKYSDVFKAIDRIKKNKYDKVPFIEVKNSIKPLI